MQIQNILNDETIFDDTTRSKILNCGPIGKILADFREYLETHKSNEALSSVANYNIVEIVLNKNIEQNFQNLELFNSKYNYFSKNDFRFNMGKFSYLGNSNFDVSNNIWTRIDYIKLLRYLSPFFESEVVDDYSKHVMRAKDFVFHKEKSYWEKYFNRPICNPADYKEACMEKIVTQIKNSSTTSEEDRQVHLSCNVVMTFEDKIYEFVLCDRLEAN